MKLAMAQMRMTDSMEENLGTSLEMCALARGSDLLFFPEIQLTPFFPQYEKRDVSKYALTPDSDMIARLKAAARDNGYYMSPNVYLELDGKRYDTSLWIDPQGEVLDSAEMVHIAQAEQFYEQDYYTPSNDGFHVFDTDIGRIGIVVCFDRHYPESIRTEALMGADLILVPTVNEKAEPLTMFEWEIRVQAFQNSVAIAMCNRVGTEDDMQFAGESLVTDAYGNLICKAGDEEGGLYAEVDLKESSDLRNKKPYTQLRRTEDYL